MQLNKYLALSAFAILSASAQISNVGKPETTATQAIITYQVADANPCTIEVRETGRTELVHDVNPALFTGSDTDLSRPGTITLGSRRIVVLGKRAAEPANDQLRYSRALQTDTDHDFKIVCGASEYSSKFRTTNIPLGNGYMEAVPADPTRPGEPGWPTVKWGQSDQRIVDPQTGVEMRRGSLERDYYITEQRNFTNAAGQNWTNASDVLNDDAVGTTYSGTDRDPLFLHLDYFSYYGGSHNFQVPRPTELQVELNAWCEGGDCTTASAADRSLEVCLSIDRLSCASPTKTIVLAACSSNCTGATPHRYFVGDTLGTLTGHLENWFPGVQEPGFDYTSFYEHTGTVNRDGNQLTWVGGNYFDLHWVAGSKITVNNVEYTIASIQSPRSLTLAGAPAGVENSVPFQGTNFGILVRKSTASATPFKLQFAKMRMLFTVGIVSWEAAGGIEGTTNCSHELVPGPGGELGWHCVVSLGLYWIGRDSGKTNLLGLATMGYRPGVDGWNFAVCSPGFWDKQHGNYFYCSATQSDGDLAFVRITYHGNNESVAPLSYYNTMPDCDAGAPQPCFTFENLTPKSQNRSLRQLATAFHPDLAAFPFRQIVLTSGAGTSRRFLFTAFRDLTVQDSMGFYLYFNVDTLQVEGGNPTWKYWPLRWGVLHGNLDLGDNDWTFLPTTYFRGPFTGTDTIAGNGPYHSRVASGPIPLTGEACPVRPVNSLIPANEWPTGNRCLTVTIDGEPGDPTPKMSTSGTVSVTGDVVTLTGGTFPTDGNGQKMKIGSTFYVFTRTSDTTGTLAPQPVVAINNSAYTLFLEEVDNPKTGPNRRETAYLQDLEVRDIVCLRETLSGPVGGCGLFFFQTEFFRILIKDGLTLTLQRGYSKNGPQEQAFALPANAYLIPIPPMCDMTVYSCGRSNGYWNATLDPLGQNLNGTTITETVSNGSGHFILRPVGEVSAVAFNNCPQIDGVGYSCYNARLGNNLLQTLTSTDNITFAGQPLFHGKMGIGIPNAVDSHPSMPGLLHPMHQQPSNARRWFLDGRVFNGGANFTGGPNSQALRITGDLYKFTASQFGYMRRKILPTMANCGKHPLLDVSGPATVLGGTSTDAYRYCVAAADGECQPGSQTGDVFVNCPYVDTPYCKQDNIASIDSDARDICIGDNAAYTESIIQGGFEKRNMFALYSRPLTKGLIRNRYADVFWNVKTTPDGKWMFHRGMWINDYGHELLLVKLPPFPEIDDIRRGDFIPVEVRIPASADPLETHALVEFGYDTNFHCTSRHEACLKGAGSDVFSWKFENPTGIACQNGCTVQVPGIPQRILYYRVIRQKAGNVRGSEGHVQVTALP